MDEPVPSRQRAGLSDYLAAERTLLAWVRTGLALMGFGFVVARFGLFLQELEIENRALSNPPSYGLSLWFGTALIAAGEFVNVVSGWQHAQLTDTLNRGESAPARSAAHAVGIAVFLALVGLAMAIYLLSVRRNPRSSSGHEEEVPMALQGGVGIVNTPSHHLVKETVERLRTALQERGVTLFALVDHDGEAQKVGMKMPPTKLLIFGSPKAGTPVMLAAPSAAIDLPLKILIWEDRQGRAWVSYNSPAYLRERHGLPAELLPALAVVEALAASASE